MLWKDKYRKDHSWTRSFSVQECVTCGECRDVRGLSTYTGCGLFAYLNGLTRDPPAGHNHAAGEADAGSSKHFTPGGHGRFARVPLRYSARAVCEACRREKG